MHLNKNLCDWYQAVKGRSLVKTLSRDPGSYFIFLPQNTKKTFVDIYIKAGALSEKGERAGIGHLLEHYIAGFASKQLPQGVAFNAKINDDFIVFYIESDDVRELSVALTSFFQILMNPDFSHREIFEYEKRSLANELENERNDTELALERLVERSRYIDDPNGRSFVDHLSQLESLSLEDISTYYKRILTKDNLAVLVSANRLDSQIRDNISSILHKWNLPAGSTDFPQPAYSDSNLIFKEDSRISGNYTVLTFPAPSRAASLKDAITTALMIDIIKDEGNESIRRRIREAGIYDFKVMWKSGIYNGYVALWSYMANDQIVPWIRIIDEYIVGLSNVGPSPLFLKRTKEKRIQSVLPHWRSNQGRFDIVSDSLVYGEKIHQPEEIIDMIASITENDLRAMAQKVFNKRTMNLVIYGEDRGVDREAIWGAVFPTEGS